MGAAEFHKRYPCRTAVTYHDTLGLIIGTEFVGINHNTGRGRIQIYETTVYVKGTGRKLVCNSWSSSLRWARATHAVVCVAAWLGVAVWWHLRAARAPQ